MDESKKEILEKEKIYHEKKKARTPIYIVIGVLIIYAFFFTSKRPFLSRSHLKKM